MLAARERISRYLTPTPLRNYPTLDEALGIRVLVKHENHQPTNSFKIRNALAAMTALSPDAKKAGVIAASTGNHGAGVSWAGWVLKIPVTICVPVGNNPEKTATMRGYGATVIEEGKNYDDAVAVMHRLAEQRGLQPLHSTENIDVLSGTGSLTMEILEQAEAMGERVGSMVFAIGGGSQAAGAITVTRAQQPDINVYGVQAEGADAIYESWRTGTFVKRNSISTFAEGIATRSAYKLTFQKLRDGLADMVLVSDDEIASAMRMLIVTTHNLVEPSGAAGLAGLRKLGLRHDGKAVVISISGSNVDQKTLARITAAEAR
jgi:threonine dehydratase